MRFPTWLRSLISGLLLIGCAVLALQSVSAHQLSEANIKTTIISVRPPPPPTQFPPSQADNGAQVYWGMCQDCHGDQGQGLTAEWRATFAPDYQDCWASGCHGDDAPQHSFQLPKAGAPALAGPGALPRFFTAFELGTYIQDSMPLYPAGSISPNQNWELTSYLLALNDKDLSQITLSGNTGAAIPVHHKTEFPENEFPGTILFSLVLLLAAVGVGTGIKSGSIMKRAGKENFYHHLHPPKIPAQQAHFSYTLGAGGLSIFLSLVLLITGALEMYYYIPIPEQAGPSIQMITTLVPYGNLVRNLHFWSAQLLVIVLMVHLIRIIFTGAYAPPRRFNYVLGIVLLVLVLLLDFTGYVLRWDEGIRWALIVGTNLIKTIPGIGEGLYSFLIGGAEPGPAALTRFYSWHIYGLTFAFIGVTAWHIFKIRRDGGISSPPSPKGQSQESIPRNLLVRKEVLAMLIAGVVLLVLSALIPAPIDQPITDSGNLIGDSQAPWFFLWIQETLKWGDPFLWGIGIPLLAVLVLALLPYILPNAPEEELGNWFPSGNRTGRILGSLILIVIFVLTILGWVR
jgi:quinol-cytochrome oxidoreductase complex cytochrome b subunit/mono/diheme cytochrome c family protein